MKGFTTIELLITAIIIIICILALVVKFSIGGTTFGNTIHNCKKIISSSIYKDTVLVTYEKTNGKTAVKKFYGFGDIKCVEGGKR